MAQTILITGGAGFIGSHVVRRFVNRYPEKKILNLDLLTYAGNLENLRDIEQAPNYTFIKGDIADQSFVKSVFEQYHPDGVINLAAESHVDNSIRNPKIFLETNVMGVQALINVLSHNPNSELIQISTDEVYGEVMSGHSLESDVLNPSSPYSASKAGAELLLMSAQRTYGLKVRITRGSNTYGQGQFPEKKIGRAHV